jgi:hypothetical protein
LIELLCAAIAYGGDTHSVADVADAVVRGDAQLWKNDRGIVITEIRHTPKYDTLHFWLAAGEKDATLQLMREAESWARTQGIRKLSAVGRKGWVRVLRNDGWTPSALVLLEKDLSGEQGR